MKNLKNNTLGVALLVVGLLVVTLGITYAVVLVYDGIEGVENSQLVLGDIYMHYNETNQLMLEDAIPSLGPDESKYFEFTVSGKNTYDKKDIWYEIVLNHGDDHATRQTRIRDNLLKFRLVEIKDNQETVVLDNENYTSLNNQRIWVNTIKKNTTSDIEITYRLYMWIDYNTAIGNTSDADYDFDTWNNQVYGSIKVNVNGDFTIKKVENSEDFKELVTVKNDDTCKTYVEEDGIIYISGTKDCIDFNYVWYSGKLWRITAIYPDGTMKMITDSAITTIAYGSDANFYTDENNTSYMYQWLNEDFLDTLYNYENIIVTDYKWNATSGNGTISYKLPTTVEEGATLVEAPVGLLNSYEYYKGYQNTSSLRAYLVINYSWWLLNRYDTEVYFADSGGAYGYTHYSSAMGVRPSINLKPTIELNGGSGTKTDPYKIKGDKEEAVVNTTLLNTRTSGEYVTFAGEDYRIVGTEVIVDSDTNEEKTITKLNKLDYVRDESDAVITKKFARTATFGLSTNTQSDDYCDYYLNNTWKTALDDTYEGMLVEGTYYLGKTSNNYKLSICQTASNTVTTKECEKTTSTWTGYAGLPRYGEMFASQQGSGSFSSSDMWLITLSSSSSGVWSVINNGHGGNNLSPSNMHAVRPSINLKSEIIIKSGSGTKEDPFIVGLPN